LEIFILFIIFAVTRGVKLHGEGIDPRDRESQVEWNKPNR